MKSLHWIIVATLFVHSHSQAAVTISIEESGSDVVATATGTLNTNGLSGGPATVLALIQYVDAGSYAYLIGQGGGNSATVFAPAFGTAQPLQNVAIDETADSSTGGPVGVDSSGGSVRLFVPNGYTTGTPISASSTWTNTTLAGLNLTPGSYVFDYGIDQITFVVGAPVGPNAPTSVPVMPTWMLALMILGFLVVAARVLHRKRDV